MKVQIDVEEVRTSYETWEKINRYCPCCGKHSVWKGINRLLCLSCGSALEIGIFSTDKSEKDAQRLVRIRKAAECETQS